jgi:hypothetical protein
MGTASAQDSATRTTATLPEAGAQASFASLKQIDAGPLSVGYAEEGPAQETRKDQYSPGTYRNAPASPGPYEKLLSHYAVGKHFL